MWCDAMQCNECYGVFILCMYNGKIEANGTLRKVKRLVQCIWFVYANVKEYDRHGRRLLLGAHDLDFRANHLKMWSLQASIMQFTWIFNEASGVFWRETNSLMFFARRSIFTTANFLNRSVVMHMLWYMHNLQQILRALFGFTTKIVTILFILLNYIYDTMENDLPYIVVELHR